MPRIAEPDPGDRQFPWLDWEDQLRKSPTKALLFGEEDFGELSPRRFRDLARKAFRHMEEPVIVRVRGEEVKVTLCA